MRRPARFAPQAVDMQVVQDGEQPLARAVALAPLLQPGQRPLQRVLDQIVGLAFVARERARVAAQASGSRQPRHPGERARALLFPANTAQVQQTRRGQFIPLRRQDTRSQPIKIKCVQEYLQALVDLVYSWSARLIPRETTGGHGPRAPCSKVRLAPGSNAHEEEDAYASCRGGRRGSRHRCDGRSCAKRCRHRASARKP